MCPSSSPIRLPAAKGVDPLIESLTETNAVLTGPSYTGKTTALERHQRTRVLTSLDELSPLATDGRTIFILDDFYSLYLQYEETSDNKIRQTFRELLARERGVCLVDRPYSFDWLVENTAVEDEFDFETAAIFHASYTEADVCHALEQVSEDIEEKAVDDLLPSLQFRYEFNHSTFGSTLESYVPYVALLTPSAEALYPGQLLEAQNIGPGSIAKDMLSNFSFSELTRNLYQRVGSFQSIVDRLSDTDTLAQLGPPSASVLGLSPTVAPVAAPFLIWLLLRDEDEDDFEAFQATFGHLFDQTLLPAAEEKLEERLGVPPRTLETARNMLHPEFYRQLRQLVDDIDPEVLQEISQTLKRHERSLSDLEEEIEGLRRSCTRTNRVVSQGLENAVRELSWLESQLLEAERRRYSGIDYDSLAEVPYISRTAEEAATKFLNGRSVVVLSGPHGAGKSTALWQAGNTLERHGYRVMLPNLESESLRFVRSRLEVIDRPTVLATSYRIGELPVEDGQALAALLKLVEEGVCDGLLLECRSEIQDQLENQLRLLSTKREFASIWQARTVVSCEFPPKKELKRVLTNIFEAHGYRPENGVTDAIVSLTDGNPLLAKYIVKMVVNQAVDGVDLNANMSIYDFVWRQIQNLTTTESGSNSLNRAHLLDFLAMTRGGRTVIVQEFLDVSPLELEELFSELEPYLNRENVDGDEWVEVTPEVYTSVLFRKRVLPRFETYLCQLSAMGSRAPLESIGMTLTMQYQHAHRTNNHKVASDIQAAAQQLLYVASAVADSGDTFFRTCVSIDLPVGLSPEDGARLNGNAVHAEVNLIPDKESFGLEYILPEMAALAIQKGALFPSSDGKDQAEGVSVPALQSHIESDQVDGREAYERYRSVMRQSLETKAPSDTKAVDNTIREIIFLSGTFNGILAVAQPPVEEALRWFEYIDQDIGEVAERGDKVGPKQWESVYTDWSRYAPGTWTRGDRSRFLTVATSQFRERLGADESGYLEDEKDQLQAQGSLSGDERDFLDAVSSDERMASYFSTLLTSFSTEVANISYEEWVNLVLEHAADELERRGSIRQFTNLFASASITAVSMMAADGQRGVLLDRIKSFFETSLKQHRPSQGSWVGFYSLGLAYLLEAWAGGGMAGEFSGRYDQDDETVAGWVKALDDRMISHSTQYNPPHTFRNQVYGATIGTLFEQFSPHQAEVTWLPLMRAIIENSNPDSEKSSEERYWYILLDRIVRSGQHGGFDEKYVQWGRWLLDRQAILVDLHSWAINSHEAKSSDVEDCVADLIGGLQQAGEAELVSTEGMARLGELYHVDEKAAKRLYEQIR